MATLLCRLYRPRSTTAGTAEPTGSAFALAEFLNDIEGDLHDWHDYELRQPVQRAEGKRLSTTIPGGNEYLTLVIRIDQTDQIAEDDAVLMGQPRARQDDRRKPGIGKMDGNA